MITAGNSGEWKESVVKTSRLRLLGIEQGGPLTTTKANACAATVQRMAGCRCFAISSCIMVISLIMPGIYNTINCDFGIQKYVHKHGNLKGGVLVSRISDQRFAGRWFAETFSSTCRINFPLAKAKLADEKWLRNRSACESDVSVTFSDTWPQISR